MAVNIIREKPESEIFTNDIKTENHVPQTKNEPIMNYNGFIRPQNDEKAVEKGDRCAQEIKSNIIGDFEKNDEYCKNNNCDNIDRMVHVSTFKIIDGIIYMTYYANTGSDAEDPDYQEARLAFCPENNVKDMTIVTIQKVGDMLDGRKITKVYDTILMHTGGDKIYVMWTAADEKQYYRFYCTFDIKTHTLSAIRPNRFKVNEITNDFSMSGIKSALSYYNIPHKSMFVDIGIMQKLSSRVENGETYYYTGAYSGNMNCIIKSKDLITWQYVSTPDFINLSLWENATYVIGDKCYYFVRQNETGQGFLTCYDLVNEKWDKPFLIADTQSRSDFIYYKNELYLVHAPINRDGFGIIKVNRDDLSRSVPILVCNMKESCFYPFVRIYGDEMYISYTVDRKHIRLSKFNFEKYL